MDKREQGKIALADFFIAYSAMDRAVGEAIKAMLKVRGADEDLTIVALGDFARRANLLWAGLDSAMTFGTTKDQQPPRLDEGKGEAGIKAIKKALELNLYRVKLAHGHLVQNDDGSFEVTYLKIVQGTIRRALDRVEVTELQAKVAQMQEAVASMQKLAGDLSTVVIQLEAINLTVGTPDIPSASGMFTDTGGSNR